MTPADLTDESTQSFELPTTAPRSWTSISFGDASTAWPCAPAADGVVVAERSSMSSDCVMTSSPPTLSRS